MRAPHKSQRPAGTGRQGGKQKQQANLHLTLHQGGDPAKLAVLAETADPEPARADDRRWFAAHPQRGYRLRGVIGNEWGGAVPDARWVLVRQARPGVRGRRPVLLTRDLPDDDWLLGGSPAVDAVLAIIEDGLARRPSEVFMIEDALALASIGGSA